MKVLFDHQIFSDQIYGGISRYFCELTNCFAGNDEVLFDLAVCLSNNSYLLNSPHSKVLPFFPAKKFTGKTTIITGLNKFRSRMLLMQKNYDIFHPTNYDPYFLPLLGNKPFVVTVYDMIHELYPDIYPAADKTRQWKRTLVDKAAKVIAISENTKMDLVKLYKIDERKVEVVYLANSFKPGLLEFDGINLPEKYIFFVGERRFYKNFTLMIKAVAPLMLENPELSVVCAGGGTFSGAEASLFEGAGIAGRVSHYSVSDGLLAYLYQRAAVFVFPSSYEGFGIPVLEAYTKGCPMVVSNSSSLPELAGDAALYFEPNDATSLREAVRQVLYEDGLRELLVARGRERAKKFSWEKTAAETKLVYQNVVNSLA